MTDPVVMPRTAVLKRTDYREDGVFGELQYGDTTLFTLEHAFEADFYSARSFEPKIPAGIYTCKRGTHQLDRGPKIVAFEVMNVPGHTGILLHVGNVNANSDGCVLLGDQIFKDPLSGQWSLLNSRFAFNALMTDFPEDEFVITIEA